MSCIFISFPHPKYPHFLSAKCGCFIEGIIWQISRNHGKQIRGRPSLLVLGPFCIFWEDLFWTIWLYSYHHLKIKVLERNRYPLAWSLHQTHTHTQNTVKWCCAVLILLQFLLHGPAPFLFFVFSFSGVGRRAVKNPIRLQRSHVQMGATMIFPEETLGFQTEDTFCFCKYDLTPKNIPIANTGNTSVSVWLEDQGRNKKNNIPSDSEFKWPFLREWWKLTWPAVDLQHN